MIPTHTITQGQVGISAARPVAINVMRIDSGGVAPHDHDYYEVSFVCGGSAVHQTPYADRPIGRGAVIVVAPGSVHAFSNPEQLDIVNVYYLAEWLVDDLAMLWRQPGLVPLFLASTLFGDRSARRIPLGQLPDEELQLCCAEVEAIARENRRETPSLLLLRSALLKLMVMTARHLESEAGDIAHSFRREVWLTMDRVEQCIAQGEPFRVAATASAAGVSTDYLSRIFRQATGDSPMEYYQRRRVQHAGRLLLDAEREVSEVAHALGFCDAAHFSKVFRRVQGMSPRAYRVQYGLRR